MSDEYAFQKPRKRIIRNSGEIVPNSFEPGSLKDVARYMEYAIDPDISEYLNSERLKKALLSVSISIPSGLSRKERRAHMLAVVETLEAMEGSRKKPDKTN